MKKLLLIAAVIFGITACVQDGDLPPCPVPGSGVDINVYAERFNGVLDAELDDSRADIPAVTWEERFMDRIVKLYYLLYKDNVLIEKGAVADMTGINGSYYTFSRENLEAGSYRLFMMANCPDMEVFPDNPEEIMIRYPGHDTTDDYFVMSQPFEVYSDTRASYNAHLKRMHGVVRFTFYDLEPCIRKIDVHIDGLSQTGCIMGTYSDDYHLNISIPVGSLGRAEGDTQQIVGLFPTLEGGVSRWDVKVYREDGETLYYEGVIPDDISVIRNQLLDLRATFQDGEMVFDIQVNKQWEDANDGGTVVAD